MIHAFGVMASCVVLAALVWAIAASYTLRHAVVAANEANWRDEASRLIEKECLGKSPPELARCAIDFSASAADHSKEARDLLAQEDMAAWTFWMLMVSIAGTGFTALGIWFVRENLRAVRVAQDTSDRALAEARSANDISRRSSMADLRPWLKIESLYVGNSSTAYRGKFEVFIYLTVENVGRSPATHVRLVLDSLVCSEPLNPWKYIDAWKHFDHPPGEPDLTVFQGQKTGIDYVHRRHVSVSEPKGRLYALVTVFYGSSLAEETHQTSRLVQLQTPSGVAGISENGVVFDFFSIEAGRQLWLQDRDIGAADYIT